MIKLDSFSSACQFNSKSIGPTTSSNDTSACLVQNYVFRIGCTTKALNFKKTLEMPGKSLLRPVSKEWSSMPKSKPSVW